MSIEAPPLFDPSRTTFDLPEAERRPDVWPRIRGVLLAASDTEAAELFALRWQEEAEAHDGTRAVLRASLALNRQQDAELDQLRATNARQADEIRQLRTEPRRPAA